MPFERAIVIPASFAIHQLRKTQLSSVFLAQKPMFPIEGRSPEDVEGAQLMEAAIDYDADATNAICVLYAFLQDCDRYGMGVLYDTWEEEPGWVMRQPAPMNPLQRIRAMIMAPQLLEPQRVMGTVREFNRWQNVDPYNFWPDPRVPLSDIQKGEYCGHRTFNGRMSILERSAKNGGPYFNVEELEKHAGQATRGREGGTGSRRTRFNPDEFMLRQGADDRDRGYFALDHFQIKLIPKEWQLGEGADPELWWFTQADESLIIRAHKSAYEHGKISYSVGEVLPDPHEILNTGMVEQMDGLQRVLDWFHNSRIANIRRAINNSIIFAPTLLEIADITHPNPAGTIRLTQKGEELLITGQLQLSSMYQQFIVQDLTAPHLQQSGVMFEMMQRMSAANDPAMGQPTPGDKTLGEVQSMLAAASQQLRIVAQLIDQQALRPLLNRSISNRQQFTSLAQWFRVTGDLARGAGMQKVQATRQQLQGGFDYIPNSGALPADPARNAELWLRMGEIASKTPQLMQPGPDGKVIDIRKIFNEGFKAAGLKNVETMYMTLPLPQLPPGIMPDAALAAGVQAGNIVPMAAA
jgi:hypothetical protein